MPQFQQQDGFIQQPASGQVACTASNGQLFYQGANNQDIYSYSGGLGFQGMGGENMAGGFAGGWVNTLDPKGVLNYDQQALLTPTWSTQVQIFHFNKNCFIDHKKCKKNALYKVRQNLNL